METANDWTPKESELDAEALSHQAGAQMSAGNFEAAIALYDRTLAQDATRANAWTNRGLSLWSLHRNEEALESLDRALALNPDLALAWMNRANVLGDLKRSNQEVLDCYDRALELDPQLPRAWFNKGDTLGHLGRFIEAKACFENARELAAAQSDREVEVAAIAMVGRCDNILMNESYG